MSHGARPAPAQPPAGKSRAAPGGGEETSSSQEAAAQRTLVTRGSMWDTVSRRSPGHSTVQYSTVQYSTVQYSEQEVTRSPWRSSTPSSGSPAEAGDCTSTDTTTVSFVNIAYTQPHLEKILNNQAVPASLSSTYISHTYFLSDFLGNMTWCNINLTLLHFVF